MPRVSAVELSHLSPDSIWPTRRATVFNVGSLDLSVRHFHLWRVLALAETTVQRSTYCRVFRLSRSTPG
jgi:hypothetical protein